MKKELPKTYSPQSVENVIYHRWEQSNYFNPDNLKGREIYSIILPPPNANGELHLGHASGYTVMDIFGRYQRMCGKKTLLLPGKDHAGIQTQVVFEKIIEKEQGITRDDLGREKFYQATYDFCIGRSNYMRDQEKKIGISADWSREKFTLDPSVLKIALETFIRLEKDELIYKGKRIINWCPRCSTALSEVEVIHKEVPGKLYYIKYPLENSSDFITIATTRPETMLGDSAVAVSPKDKRFSKIVGSNVLLPLTNRVIPIIADHRIDLTFGTGAVKITPAHDPLDWEIGKDHNLSEIQVIDEKAKITKLGGVYSNLDSLKARQQIINDLKVLSLIEKTEDIIHSVSQCERCKNTIEPLISNQWFIKVDDPKISLKKIAIESIENGSVEIYPENFKKILIDWFSNLRDWCISRQIWWGPRFPIWYCEQCGSEKYIISIERPEFCPYCKGVRLSQDENTFDTWFTSGQWPYITLKTNEADFETFYPSNMMVMGRDLLFFWSARMIMLGLYQTKQIPFKNLYFTGLIRDKDGAKMSKSRGNGIDPLEMIDKYGADALRLSLIMDTAPGQDSRLYEEKIETFRNFANKLWNISRFCLTQDDFIMQESLSEDKIVSAADYWIVDRLNETISQINILFEKKQISLAADVLKSFTWSDFADWYIEIHKQEKNSEVLGFVLDKILRMWHPFMPFITEHIWSLSVNKDLLMVSSWPKEFKFHDTKRKFGAIDTIERIVKSIVIAIRNARTENKIELSKKISVFIHVPIGENEDIVSEIESQSHLIKKLQTGVEKIIIKQTENKIADSIHRIAGLINLYIPTTGLIDVKVEKLRIEKEIKSIETNILSIKLKLGNAEFTSKAPENIIEKQRILLSERSTKLVELKKQLLTLN